MTQERKEGGPAGAGTIPVSGLWDGGFLEGYSAGRRAMYLLVEEYRLRLLEAAGKYDELKKKYDELKSRPTRST